MSERKMRTVQLVLPGGRTDPESLARIIDTLFTKGLEAGERVDSINAVLASMGEVMTMTITISAPAETVSRDAVDDRRM